MIKMQYNAKNQKYTFRKLSFRGDTPEPPSSAKTQYVMVIAALPW